MGDTKFQRTPPNPVDAYARRMLSGKVPTNDLVRLACERHLRDRKRYDSKPYHLADEASSEWQSKTPYYWDLRWCIDKLDFFPELVLWRGEMAGEPFVLLPWQMFFAGSLFGWFKRDDSYRFETAYGSLPKKSGKSLFVGAIGLLRGFFDDEPGAEVYSIATTRDQANIVWREAYELKRKSSNPLLRRLKVWEGRRNIHDEYTRSKFEPLSADKDSGDGVNPYCLIADEVHRYRSADLLNMLQESMAARRNRLTIEITTAGWNRNTICFEHDEYSQRVLEGRVKDETWFAFISRADVEDRDDWSKPSVWKKANPSLGYVIDAAQVRTAAKQAAELPSRVNDFLRFRLNVWTEQSERAIDMERWIESGKDSPTMGDLRRRRCFGGLDLANVRDLAAFTLVFPMGAEVAVLQWLWCPKVGVLKRSKEDRAPYDRWVKLKLMKATDGDTINHNVIRVDILSILEYFDLVALAYDAHNSGNLPHDLADVLDSGDEKRVISFHQGFGSMAAPCQEIERLYSERSLKHGNNEALNWMAANAAWKMNEYEEKRFDRQQSSEKIDGMVSLAMGIGAWLKHKDDSEPEESVYDREDRGLAVF